MCGRFTLHTRLLEVVDAMGVDEVEDGYEDIYGPSYNIAPTQQVAGIVMTEGRRRLERMSWGITPNWDRNKHLINARAETLAEKPTFKSAFNWGRCLIVADGFYEWRRKGNNKTPYYFRLAAGGVFGFAGLSQIAEGGAECAIVTTGANGLVGEIHDRMPVILRPETISRWLSKESDKDELLSMINVPYDARLMEAYEVSALVNSPGNNSERLIASVGANG
jgi:putative SOS response-associated peptidase YedK